MSRYLWSERKEVRRRGRGKAIKETEGALQEGKEEWRDRKRKE